MDEALKEAFRRGYMAGFADSSEGWNGECGPTFPLESDADVCAEMEKRLAEFEAQRLALPEWRQR